MSSSPSATRPADTNTDHADSPMRKRPRLEQDVTNTDDTLPSRSESTRVPSTSETKDSPDTTGSRSETLSAGLKLSNTSGITLNLRNPTTSTSSSQQEAQTDTEAASTGTAASQTMQDPDDEEPTSDTHREASMSSDIVLIGEESDETVVDDFEDVGAFDEEMVDEPPIDLEEIMTRFPFAHDGNQVEAVRRLTKLITEGWYVSMLT